MLISYRKANQDLAIVRNWIFGSLFQQDSLGKKSLAQWLWSLTGFKSGSRVRFDYKTNLVGKTGQMDLQGSTLHFQGSCQGVAPAVLQKLKVQCSSFGSPVIEHEISSSGGGKFVFSLEIQLEKRAQFISIYAQTDTEQWRLVIRYRLEPLISQRDRGRQRKPAADLTIRPRTEGNSQVGVAFIFFRRPRLTSLCFAEIRKHRPAILLLIADGARNQEDALLLEECKAIVEQIDWPCEVHRNYATQNMGCKERVASGLHWAFTLCEEVIILEDDCLPNSSFFTFCENLLEKYRHDDRIMHISGSSFVNAQLPNDSSYWFSKHSDIWGWATWRRAFEKYDPDMVSWPVFLREFGAGALGENVLESEYWRELFAKTHQGLIDTWDFQWHYTVTSNNGLSCVPRSNLITNLGFGSDATHTIVSESHVSMLATHTLDAIRHPEFVAANRSLDQAFFYNRYFGNSLQLPEKANPHLFRDTSVPWTLVITHNEISERHGTGALLLRLLQGRNNIIHIKTRRHYAQVEVDLDSHLLTLSPGQSDSRYLYRHLLEIVGDRKIDRILAVPFSEEECLLASVARDIFKGEMAMYLMDDQNIHDNKISDATLKDLIQKSDLRLTICEPMTQAYSAKFGFSFETLLPSISPHMIQDTPLTPSLDGKPSAVTIGNVWTEEWLKRLADLGSGISLHLDWYGNVGEPFLKKDHGYYSAKGIEFKGFVEEKTLMEKLRGYAFAIVPTATKKDASTHSWLAALSFPSKIITLAASGNLPIILLGDRDSPGGKFIEEEGIGLVCEYSPKNLEHAVNEICRPENQRKMRQAAVALAQKCSSEVAIRKIFYENIKKAL